MWTWFQINFKNLVQDSMFTCWHVHNQKTWTCSEIFWDKNGYVHMFPSSEFRNVIMISNQFQDLSPRFYVPTFTTKKVSMLWNFFWQSEDHLSQGPDPLSENAQIILPIIYHPMLFPDPMAIRNSRVLG